MIDTPQFRTVLRGADPEQVAEAFRELQTSLVVSRRAAADRTIELSRLQEEHQTLQAELRAAHQRLAELEHSGGPEQPEAPRHDGNRGYTDLGARIGSMLSLAEEEATQIRAAAEQDAAQRRDEAVRALAGELDAVQARLDETVARTAALGDELDQRRAHADEEHGRRRDQAAQDAEQIRQQARAEAAALHRQAEEGRAAAVAQREEVHQHLGRIVQLIGGVLDGQPEVHRPEQATGLEPTVDDVTPQWQGAQEAQGAQGAQQAQQAQEARVTREAQRDRKTAADATIPDVTRNGEGEAARHGRRDERQASGPFRSADATQVFEPVHAEGAQRDQAAVGPHRGTSETRRTRRTYAGDGFDGFDSFVGEPWQQEEDVAPPR